MSCIPALFCDDNDIMLLQQIGREITGQEQLSSGGTTSTGSVNAEVSVRLTEVKGSFRNRLSGKECFSVDGIRLVAAILKDSEIVAASNPSEPLECSYPGISRGLGVSFQAKWNQANGVLSFDHSFDDFTVYELMLALVNIDEAADNVRLVCPCGKSTLQISSSQKNGKQQLSLLSLPSPRHYIAFPAFKEQASTRAEIPTNVAKRFRPERDRRPMRKDTVELSYLSLAECALSVDVSWKEKELDVEVWHADQGRTELSVPFPERLLPRQLVLMDSSNDGYVPVRGHRWQEENNSDEKLEGVTVEESPISVTVDSLDSLATKQYSSLMVNDEHATKTPPFPESDSEILNSLIRALENDFGKTAREDIPESRMATRRSTSDMTQVPPIPEDLDSPSCQMKLKPKPKARRGWTKAFRKVRPSNTKEELGSSATITSDCSEKSAFQELDSSRSSTFVKHEFKAIGTADLTCEDANFDRTDQCVASISVQHGNVEAEGDNSLLASTVGEDTISMVTIPRALRKPDAWKMTDHICASSLFDSICSWGGHEQINMEIQESVDEEATRRVRSRVAGESRNPVSTSTSNAHIAPDEIPTSPLKTVVPLALSSKISDLTVDVDAKYRRALLKYHGLERFQSLDESVSKKSISDETTAFTLMEDRVLRRAYAACGGDYLDSLTDALFGSAPALTQGDLDDANDSISEEKKSDYPSVDLAYTRTDQDQSGIDHQLTTITEESEAFVTLVDLPRNRASTEVDPSFSFDESHAQTYINEFGRSSSF